MEYLMPDLLLASIEYSGYISIVKFVIFLVLFFLWLPLLGWVYTDARAVETKEFRWTGIVLAAAAVGSIIWLLVPFFIIGLLLYIIAVGAASISYVTHRNARVMDFDRVLTAEHIKGLLFSSEARKIDALKSFLFITANSNEVPIPQPRTPDFYGYKTAYDIFTDAIWHRANAIALSPTPQNYNVIYQVDGAALKQPAIARNEVQYFIRFIKNLADMDTKEKRKPQKGKFKIKQEKGGTEWEVTTAGSTAGEQIQIKMASQDDIKKLADIGLMPEQVEQLNKMRQLKQGLFIIAGSKKAGVTTTFYALLRSHDAFLNSINTLEKHPTVELPNITQDVFTLSDTGTTTYSKKLLSIVRMGPDIVGVADCESSEIAHVACEAAKDGKIIYVTLEADNVIQALDKWIKLVGDRELVAETLLGISNQRLLRKLCEECKQAYGPNRELLKKFNIPAEKAKVLHRPGKVQYDKHGKPVTCEHCQGTGYLGRISVFEIITLNDDLRKAVKQLELSEIGVQFRRAKMLYLQEQALRRVVTGKTAINEMVRIFSTSEK
jgi:type II secretory ATPase GspE/PulE/Tfp pilus assembly ATPase PilB-like protein